MRYSLIAIAIAAVVADASLATAAPPNYQPYGSWRGHIRYHEGPNGAVRTRIRWANGVTPVGGQVLMHFATVAGNVATNPDFLGAVTGLPPVKREASPKLIESIDDIEKGNKKVFTRLEELRADLGLPPFESATGHPGPVPNQTIVGGVPEGDVGGPLTKWKQDRESLKSQIIALGTAMAEANAIGDKLTGDAATTRMAVLQKLKTAKALRFVAMAPASTTSEATADAFDMRVAAIKQIVDKIRAEFPTLAALGDEIARRRGRPEFDAEVAETKQWLQDSGSIRL